MITRTLITTIYDILFNLTKQNKKVIIIIQKVHNINNLSKAHKKKFKKSTRKLCLIWIE